MQGSALGWREGIARENSSCPTFRNGIQDQSNRFFGRRGGQPKMPVPTIGHHANDLNHRLCHGPLYQMKRLPSSRQASQMAVVRSKVVYCPLATLVFDAVMSAIRGATDFCWKEVDALAGGDVDDVIR